MNNQQNQDDVINALSRIIAQNADWLDGRQFQKLALSAAQANFSEDDLDHYGTFDDIREAFVKAAESALS